MPARGLLTGAANDFVPGNLAGALALREAGSDATAVTIGYFGFGGNPRDAMSGGTVASGVGATLTPSFAFRDGRLIEERTAKRMVNVRAKGKPRPAISYGGTEHFALPRAHPPLRDVEVGVGWFGPASRPLSVLSAGIELITKIPRARGLLLAGAGKLVKGSSGGPDEQAREQSASYVTAIAYDMRGNELAAVELSGVNGYTLTGRLMAWEATEVAANGFRATGALGPVDAFGLERLERGVAEAGLSRA